MSPDRPHSLVSRRGFLEATGRVGVAAGFAHLYPGNLSAAALPHAEVLDGRDAEVEITISERPWVVDGRSRTAVTINDTVPGPLLRLREGGDAVIHVRNDLAEDTSVHWHGILLPNQMDGVPGVNFPGIAPGETFTYRFPVRQAGTYWYHSHSGFQEQIGHFAGMVIDPAGQDPDPADREYVVVLSDWTFENPSRIVARLKKHPDYYNHQRRSLLDFFADASEQGLGATLKDRLDWGRMRMMASDISDITGTTYTYLVNGRGPADNWTGPFEPGERVKLRLINAAAATYFDVRVPGLPLRVVQASGQAITPVEVDELRVAIGETYDVIVEPLESVAYTLFAEAMDRSGFARGTLAPSPGMTAPLPQRRERPLLTMADMGHAMDHGGGMDMAAERDTEHNDHAGHNVVGGGGAVPQMPGMLPKPQEHGPDRHGVGNAGVAAVALSRLADPGIGLGRDGWRVLRYTDLRARRPWDGFRAPNREIELHLTGNMERYMWSIDGVGFRDAAPIQVRLGERIRLTMINDTMMNHPMHLHGMWMELENGHGPMIPRVHTVNVKPAERISLLFNADALGPWAFHCHVVYHMDQGMFRIVQVSEGTGPVDERPKSESGE